MSLNNESEIGAAAAAAATAEADVAASALDDRNDGSVGNNLSDVDGVIVVSE